MKVGVLYICTGQYIRFWPEFYRTAQDRLLPEAEKHYFVFTDSSFPEEREDHVTRVHQANLGWPDNTLKRFHMFLSIEEVLEPFDYLYFFNANCRFSQRVGEEFLPESPERLLVVQHPGQIDKAPDRFPYERNPRSRAAIPQGLGKHYVCGGINGGAARTFLQFCRTARRAIDLDYADGIVAQWHDESHLNRYILDHPYTLRSAGYCYPENWKLKSRAEGDIPKIIEVRDKKTHGGRDQLRALNRAGGNDLTVTAALCGGMGNQMFQYAAGRALADRIGARLQLDTRHYDRHTAFPYALGGFAIDAVIGTSRTLPPPKSRKLKYLAWRHFGQGARMIRERGLSFNRRLVEARESVYLHGYWQSERYFQDCADRIRGDLTIIAPPDAESAETAERIAAGPSIAVHVRRGDYVNDAKTQAFHGSCSLQYYRNGVQRIAESTGGRATVFLFSDDPQWAAENLRFDVPTVTVNRNGRSPAIQDLRLMSMCDHQVIANSSFSWWAAWLNPSPNKIVIAPQHWFADTSAENRDIVPEAWQRLDNRVPDATARLAA